MLNQDTLQPKQLNTLSEEDFIEQFALKRDLEQVEHNLRADVVR